MYQPAASVLETAARIVKTFGATSSENLLYARVDGVLKDGKLLLMELELIEPDLYFSHFPEGKTNFFNALASMGH